MRYREYISGKVAPAGRLQFWSDAVSDIFFPLASRFEEPVRFNGILQHWELEKVSLSHFESDPVAYKRDKSHLRRLHEEQLLVTFAVKAEILFSQNKIELKGGKNQFLIQRGHLPYEFEHSERNELWVLKVPAPLLRRFVRSVDSFSCNMFAADRGIGGLLFDTIRLLPARLKDVDGPLLGSLDQYLVELLALALESDDRVLGSSAGTVQKAHLARIDRYIRQNLADRSLSSETIAAACGISSRYLHALFQSSGSSVGRWIRELRLRACEAELRNPKERSSIAEIAYRWGFGDQAQFSRHFKSQFGRTPSEVRLEGRDAIRNDANL
jgi:AraC-like DNA-binding protein